MTVNTDEISFRSLYLIIRRGLPFIVIVALVAGTVGYFSVTRKPELFRVSSTVILAPPSVEFVGEGVLRFQPLVYATLNQYKALALSKKVMAETLEVYPETNLTVSDLKAASSIIRSANQVTDGVGKGVPLVVVHKLVHADRDTAADLTNTWVEVTLTAVRESLLAPLAPSNSSIVLRLQNISEELKTIETEWQKFRSIDNFKLLESNLVNTNQKIVKGTNRLEELDSLTRVAEREQMVLESQLLEISGFADPMRDIHEGLLDTQSEKMELKRKLRASKLKLELSIAERSVLQEQLQDLVDTTSGLLTRLSELAQKREEISRRLSDSRTSYRDLSATSTAIQTVRGLTLASANTLSLAKPPINPLRKNNPWHAAALAAVIASMVATLPFFLRESVRSPISIKDSPAK